MNMKTILIVDDDTNILDLLGQILSKEEFHVLKAASGKEALRLIEKHIPDLLILDIVLEDMNGGELYSVIRQRTKRSDIPVIFLTGLITSSEKNDHLIIKIGNVAHQTLSKPFEIEEILSLVKKFFPPS